MADAKTPSRPLHDGFNLLAFNSRHEPAPQSSRSGDQLLIKPSPDAINDGKRQLKGLGRQHVGSPTVALINEMHPMISGWCNSCRSGVSKEVFHDVDRFM